MEKGPRKPRTASQKAASIRNIKKAQEARDRATISAAEKNLSKGKSATALSTKQKAILGVVGAVGAANIALGGLAAGGVSAAAMTGGTYAVMRHYNKRQLQEAGHRTGHKTYNLKGTNPNRLTSRQLAWSYGLGGVVGMGAVRGYNAVTGKKK